MMHVGLTGSRGWIGKYLIRVLCKYGFCVYELDELTRAPFGRPNWDSSKHLDWVVHLGSKTSISESFIDPFAFYQSNLISTLIAMEIAQKGNASFLYVSSYVYGLPEYLPIDEQHPVSSTNPYMSSKVLGERITDEIGMRLQLPVLILRVFNVYGPGLKKGRLISDLMHQALAGETLRVNDPEPKRDYLYISDFCSLIHCILLCKSRNTGIYNVGYGRSYTNLEVAELVRRVFRDSVAIEICNRPRPNDIKDCTMFPGKVREAFNWTPIHSLESGLKEMFELSCEKPL